MECITTVSYSILVNGEPKGMITSSKGLQQGDHLSPYLSLFIHFLCRRIKRSFALCCCRRSYPRVFNL